MIILLLIIFIIMAAIGIWLSENTSFEMSGGAMGVIGLLGTVASCIAMVVLIIQVSNLTVINEKIAMYQEENHKIETQITETVQQYQEYESGIFTEVAPESSVTLVALYPELKADTLVQKQIEVYVTNNEKIKELKESNITGNVERWWLYFGGKRNGNG